MAVSDAHVFSGFLTLVLTQLSIQNHRLLFSHASAEVRGENTLEREFASTGSRTHNHQAMSPTRSPLSHPGGARLMENSVYVCNMHWSCFVITLFTVNLYSSMVFLRFQFLSLC